MKVYDSYFILHRAARIRPGLHWLQNCEPTGAFILLQASWPSGNAFVSGAEGLRFKSRVGQIGHSVANDLPPLRHFFKSAVLLGCNDAEMDLQTHYTLRRSRASIMKDLIRLRQKFGTPSVRPNQGTSCQYWLKQSKGTLVRSRFYTKCRLGLIGSLSNNAIQLRSKRGWGKSGVGQFLPGNQQLSYFTKWQWTQFLEMQKYYLSMTSNLPVNWLSFQLGPSVRFHHSHQFYCLSLSEILVATLVPLIHPLSSGHWFIELLYENWKVI